jgi:hypothetical protein
MGAFVLASVRGVMPLRSQALYQSPRDNPSLKVIELEDAACSYQDWIERITAKYYAPNAAARALEANKRIRWMVSLTPWECRTPCMTL